MAVVTNQRFTDKHPFTPDSTLKLSGTVQVPDNSVIFCNLFPVTSYSASCGYISAVSRDGTTGIITVSAVDGGVLCTISFTLSLNAEQLAGVAEDIRGLYCGTMVLRSDWLPLFYGSYKPEVNALKLLPSACRLLVVPDNAAINNNLIGVEELRYNGTKISSIGAGGENIKEDEYGTIYVDLQTESNQPKPITSFAVNGKQVSGDTPVLLATGGGLQISTGPGEIIIGEGY